MADIVVPQDGGWTLSEAVVGHLPNLLLYGPPGTGKSTFACRHGATSWYRIYCHEEMSDLDILGGPALLNDNGATASAWQDGIGLRAWREGKRLVIDEIDKAGGAALTALLGITEDPVTAAYTIPMTGETVQPKKGFHCIATMNELPDDLPEALRDRFTVRLEITQPHPKALDSLPADLRAAAKISAGLPEERRVSIRAWSAFANLRTKLKSEETAALAVFGTKARAQEVVDALLIARKGQAPGALADIYRQR